MLKVGDRLPAGSLQEFIEVEGNGCSLGPNTFDVAKLTWINGEYIRTMPRDRFIELARGFTGGYDDPKVLGLVQEKVKLLKELPERIRYFVSDDYPIDPAAVQKSCSAPDTQDRLLKLVDKFAGLASWDASSLEAALKALAAETGSVGAGEFCSGLIRSVEDTLPSPNTRRCLPIK